MHNNREILLRLLSYMKEYKKQLLSALISAFISVLLTLLAPILIGDAIDHIVDEGQVDFDNILRTVMILTGTVLGSAFFQWFMTYFTNKIAYGTIRDLRKTAFNKLGKVPISYIDIKSHGDIMNSIVNDIDIISDGLLHGFAQLFTGTITILGTLLFMLYINVYIGIAVIFLTPLSLFVAGFISKRTYNKFKEQSAIRGELSGYIEEIIGNQKLVKTFSGEQKVQVYFEEINERLYHSGKMAQFYSSLTNPATRFANGIVYAAVGVIGAINVIMNTLSIGQLSIFLSYANQYTKPFNEISSVITELQAAFASARRVFEIIDEKEEIEDGEPELYTEDQLPKDVEINIHNISFSYVPDKPLIEGFSLQVKPGQRVAIVGPTGCGKTTFINLLMRFYDVNKGEIMINGVDINTMHRSDLRKMFGMVLQETWLFSGTVKENIAYGKVYASDKEIIKAAKLSHAHGFIKRLPNGYDTYISEEGGAISQGQKQLLCIARIMLTKPPMLILDEATSNIDTRTEIRIQKAFAKMMEGRTSFIVAHRLSTIREADIILVMNAGKIIEQGNHAELLEAGGFYSDLYQSQFAETH